MKPKLIVTAIGACLLTLGLALAVTPFFDGRSLSSFSLKELTRIRAFIVQSGSMSPAIDVGSLVVTIPQPTYQSSDVVTFATDAKGKNVTTHRVEFKTYPDGPAAPPVYITRGDANEEVDTTRITDAQITGKVFLTVPYAGHAAVFVKQPQGFILLVIIPATIIIYEELKSLFREIKKLLGKIRARVHLQPFQIPEIGHTRDFPKVAVVVPVLAATLLVLSATSAFFGDREDSMGNAFSAASSYIDPTPTATPTVNPTPLLNTIVEAETSPVPSPSSSPTPTATPKVTPITTPSATPET